MSLDRLMEGIMKKQNPTVAGLDPKLSYIPDHIKAESFAQHGKNLEGAAAALLAYNKGLIDALCDIVPAVKPQAAYYEMYGWPGVRALADTIAYAKGKGLFVITDGKRNDIGATMEAYAAAHLGETDVEGESFTAFGGRPHGQRLSGHRRHRPSAEGLRPKGRGHLRAGQDLQPLLRRVPGPDAPRQVRALV